MASLLELLFETMPLAGVRRKVSLERSNPMTPDPLAKLPIHYVKDHLETLSPVELFMVKNDNTYTAAQLKKMDRTMQPVWSYDASADLHSIKNLDCRSEQELSLIHI